MEINSDVSDATFKCTAGFGVRGDSGAKYILTAGHCQYDDGSWPATYWYTKDHNYIHRDIGSWHRNVLKEGTEIDGMIIETDDIGSWTAAGKIYVRAGVGLGGYSGPSTNEEYDITDYGTSGSLIGDRVCFSGQKSADLNNYEGGSCGPVDHLYVGLLQTDVGPMDGIVVAHLCGRRGDSGGPVFRTGKALGVLSAVPGGQDDENSCDTTSPYDSSRPGTVYYTGLQPIINAFNSTIDIY